MPTNDAGQGVAVHVGDCRCPGIPHAPEGDFVTLAPRLTIPMGAALAMALNGARPDLPSVQAALTAGYMSPAPAGAIVGWSFVDEKGEPEPVTPETIERLIPWSDGGMEVAERADGLYGSDLLAPFQKRLLERSRTGSTADSTSASPSSGLVSLTPSKRSSHNGRVGKHSAARAR